MIVLSCPARVAVEGEPGGVAVFWGREHPTPYADQFWSAVDLLERCSANATHWVAEIDWVIMRTITRPVNHKFAAMRKTALSSGPMADGMKRLTIELPEDLHDAFFQQSVLSRPRRTMRERIVEFIAKETGRPIPKMVDRRKLTRDEREKLERAERSKGMKR